MAGKESNLKQNNVKSLKGIETVILRPGKKRNWQAEQCKIPERD